MMSVGERLGRWGRAMALLGLAACDNSLGAPCGRHSDCASGYCDPSLVCAAAPDAPASDDAGSPRDARVVDAAAEVDAAADVHPDAAVDAGALDAAADAGELDAGDAADAGLDAL